MAQGEALGTVSKGGFLGCWNEEGGKGTASSALLSALSCWKAAAGLGITSGEGAEPFFCVF